MALELKQSLRLSQQLLMTPQLQQAIKLLQLSRVELEEFVSKELAENPILEEVHSVQTEHDGPIERTTEQAFTEQVQDASRIVDSIDRQKSEVDWDMLSRFDESSQTSSNKRTTREGDGPNYENMVTRERTLSEHLLAQIGEFDFSYEERMIAIKLIGNITGRGYLDLDLPQFCKDENQDSELVEGVLDTIQRLDPPGIGARDLRECLLIQLRDKRLSNPTLEAIVRNHLEDLGTKNYAAIARDLKISFDDVIKNTSLLVKLNPTPGVGFNQESVPYVIPDVYVFKSEHGWHVSLNDEGLPNLKVNDYYRDMGKEIGKGKDKTYIADKVKSANWLIKSVFQRQRTILRVAESIVDRQKEFFELGMLALMPMTLKDVAIDLELHESTISRVTTNKYMHTPHGILELKFFFSSSIAMSGGGETSSESVKVKIKAILASENAKKPYSDQKIVSLLEEESGISLARRTVAKYREQLGIQPSSRRKKLY